MLLTDFAKPTTQAWFGGNLSKIVSLSAAIGTWRLNNLRPGKMVLFDSRAFTVPDNYEVANYFVWRQQDAKRNSISMRAQARFSHRELQGKNSADMLSMLSEVDEQDWPVWVGNGRVVCPDISGSILYTAPDFKAAENSWLMNKIPIKQEENNYARI